MVAQKQASSQGAVCSDYSDSLTWCQSYERYGTLYSQVFFNRVTCSLLQVKQNQSSNACLHFCTEPSILT